MSYDYQSAFNNLKQKAALVARKYQAVVEERDEARSEIERLRELVKAKEKEIELMKVKIEDLTVVTTAFPTREAVKQGKAVLSGLVREIDQCIKDLTD